MRRVLALLLAVALAVGVTASPVLAAEYAGAGGGARYVRQLPNPVQTVTGYLAAEATHWATVAGGAVIAFGQAYRQTEGTTAQKIDKGLQAAYWVVLGGVVTAGAKELLKSWQQ